MWRGVASDPECGCLGGASPEGILLKPNALVGNLHFPKETLNNQNQNVTTFLIWRGKLLYLENSNDC